MVQWEAPARVLGRPFEPIALRKDMLLASSAGDVMVEADKLKGLMEEWLSSDRAVRLEPVRPDDVPVEFFINLAGITTWRPVILRGDKAMPFLEPGLVAVAE